MTRRELQHVKETLENIKHREDGAVYGRVQLAISYVKKDLALREAQRDAFKEQYEYPGHY